MDIENFAKIFKDKNSADYKKMKYKYGENFDAFLQVLKELYYIKLPVLDFDGENLVFVDDGARIKQNAAKRLLSTQDKSYGFRAAEDEIVATSAIESIDFSRDSVRKILKGMAPADEQENRILGIKRGIEFISVPENKITEENIYRLYMMTVGDFLPPEDRLSEGKFYRDDVVYVVGEQVEHAGLAAEKVPEFMRALVKFVNCDDDINDLAKAAIVHFYMAYVHPYFDGNGRMARLLHLWFLVQKGYQSALFVPFSSRIQRTKKAYYAAFTQVEENRKYSGIIDVTPFVKYFADCVYAEIGEGYTANGTFAEYENALREGKITEKEMQLWKFVISHYGTDEFSTKQLEKDFGNAAYATIRAFVLKFEDMGLLVSKKYGARVKYAVAKTI